MVAESLSVPERDEEKCGAVSARIPLKLSESITFMILDRFDPKSS
jgi:hypothetical protein